MSSRNTAHPDHDSVSRRSPQCPGTRFHQRCANNRSLFPVRCRKRMLRDARCTKPLSPHPAARPQCPEKPPLSSGERIEKGFGSCFLGCCFLSAIRQSPSCSNNPLETGFGSPQLSPAHFGPDIMRLSISENVGACSARHSSELFLKSIRTERDRPPGRGCCSILTYVFWCAALLILLLFKGRSDPAYDCRRKESRGLRLPVPRCLVYFPACLFFLNLPRHWAHDSLIHTSSYVDSRWPFPAFPSFANRFVCSAAEKPHCSPLSGPVAPRATSAPPSLPSPRLSAARSSVPFSTDLIVVVADGMVHAITAEGQLRWSKPLNAPSSPSVDPFSVMSLSLPTTSVNGNEQRNQASSLTPASPGDHASQNRGSCRFVPGPDGQIFYRGDDGVLVALPLHVRDVVFHSPFSTPLFPSVYFLGKREAIVETLDFETGEVMGNHIQRQEETGIPYASVEPRDEAADAPGGRQLRIGQTRWVVKAMDVTTHIERWRFEWRELTPIINFGESTDTEEGLSASDNLTYDTMMGASYGYSVDDAHRSHLSESVVESHRKPVRPSSNEEQGEPTTMLTASDPPPSALVGSRIPFSESDSDGGTASDATPRRDLVVSSDVPLIGDNTECSTFRVSHGARGTPDITLCVGSQELLISHIDSGDKRKNSDALAPPSWLKMPREKLSRPDTSPSLHPHIYRFRFSPGISAVYAVENRRPLSKTLSSDPPVLSLRPLHVPRRPLPLSQSSMVHSDIMQPSPLSDNYLAITKHSVRRPNPEALFPREQHCQKGLLSSTPTWTSSPPPLNDPAYCSKGVKLVATTAPLPTALHEGFQERPQTLCTDDNQAQCPHWAALRNAAYLDQRCYSPEAARFRCSSPDTRHPSCPGQHECSVSVPFTTATTVKCPLAPLIQEPVLPAQPPATSRELDISADGLTFLANWVPLPPDNRLFLMVSVDGIERGLAVISDRRVQLWRPFPVDAHFNFFHQITQDKRQTAAVLGVFLLLVTRYVARLCLRYPNVLRRFPFIAHIRADLFWMLNIRSRRLRPRFLPHARRRRPPLHAPLLRRRHSFSVLPAYGTRHDSVSSRDDHSTYLTSVSSFAYLGESLESFHGVPDIAWSLPVPSRTSCVGSGAESLGAHDRADQLIHPWDLYCYSVTRPLATAQSAENQPSALPQDGRLYERPRRVSDGSLELTRLSAGTRDRLCEPQSSAGTTSPFHTAVSLWKTSLLTQRDRFPLHPARAHPEELGTAPDALPHVAPMLQWIWRERSSHTDPGASPSVVSVGPRRYVASDHTLRSLGGDFPQPYLTEDSFTVSPGTTPLLEAAGPLGSYSLHDTPLLGAENWRWLRQLGLSSVDRRKRQRVENHAEAALSASLSTYCPEVASSSATSPQIVPSGQPAVLIGHASELGVAGDSTASPRFTAIRRHRASTERSIVSVQFDQLDGLSYTTRRTNTASSPHMRHDNDGRLADALGDVLDHHRLYLSRHKEPPLRDDRTSPRVRGIALTSRYSSPNLETGFSYQEKTSPLSDWPPSPKPLQHHARFTDQPFNLVGHPAANRLDTAHRADAGSTDTPLSAHLSPRASSSAWVNAVTGELRKDAASPDHQKQAKVFSSLPPVRLLRLTSPSSSSAATMSESVTLPPPPAASSPPTTAVHTASPKLPVERVASLNAIRTDNAVTSHHLRSPAPAHGSPQPHTGSAAKGSAPALDIRPASPRTSPTTSPHLMIKNDVKSPRSCIPGESVLAGFVDNGRFYRTFTDIQLIGKGGFGSVYRVKHRFEHGSPEYAVKFVTLRLKASENISSRRYFREVSANRDLFSRQVVRYFTWWCEEPQFLPQDHCVLRKKQRRVLELDTDDTLMEHDDSRPGTVGSASYATVSCRGHRVQRCATYCPPGTSESNNSTTALAGPPCGKRKPRHPPPPRLKSGTPSMPNSRGASRSAGLDRHHHRALRSRARSSRRVLDRRSRAGGFLHHLDRRETRKDGSGDSPYSYRVARRRRHRHGRYKAVGTPFRGAVDTDAASVPRHYWSKRYAAPSSESGDWWDFEKDLAKGWISFSNSSSSDYLSRAVSEGDPLSPMRVRSRASSQRTFFPTQDAPKSVHSAVAAPDVSPRLLRVRHSQSFPSPVERKRRPRSRGLRSVVHNTTPALFATYKGAGLNRTSCLVSPSHLLRPDAAKVLRSRQLAWLISRPGALATTLASRDQTRSTPGSLAHPSGFPVRLQSSDVASRLSDTFVKPGRVNFNDEMLYDEEDDFIVFADSKLSEENQSLADPTTVGGPVFPKQNATRTQSPLTAVRADSPPSQKQSSYWGSPKRHHQPCKPRTSSRHLSSRSVLVRSRRQHHRGDKTDNARLGIATSERSFSKQEKRFPVTLLIQMELVSGMTLRQWLDRKERTTRVPEFIAGFHVHSPIVLKNSMTVAEEHQEHSTTPSSLLHHPSKHGRCNPLPVEVILFRQLVKGLRDIHTHGIVHRDIKPENIFINDNPLTLKIGDFGLARFIEAKTVTATQLKGPPVDELRAATALPARESSGDPQRRKPRAHLLSNVQPHDVRRVDSVISVKGLLIGTPGYTAPEGGALCTEKADVFSASLILLELLCPRFETTMERYNTLENFRIRQKIPDHVTAYLSPWADLMKRMGASNPRHRPSADMIYRSIKFRPNPMNTMLFMYPSYGPPPPPSSLGRDSNSYENGSSFFPPSQYLLPQPSKQSADEHQHLTLQREHPISVPSQDTDSSTDN